MVPNSNRSEATPSPTPTRLPTAAPGRRRRPPAGSPSSPHFGSGKAQTPLDTYMRDINRTALLTAAEEQEIARSVAAGDSEARDHLVRANLRLVVNIARDYLGRGLLIQDLIAEGNLGLLRASESFDPARGVRFSTYASYWIKQSIKRGLLNTGRTIRLPEYMADLLVKWRRTAARLQSELGRAPTREEIAASLMISPKKLRIIDQALRIYQAGAWSGDEEAGRSLEELCMDRHAGLPLPQAGTNDDVHQVLDLLDELEEREAKVLRLRFGLGSEEPMTLHEVGAQLGLTRERVRQIERDALAKLRDKLDSA